MNFYSLAMCFALSFFVKETKQFVEFSTVNIKIVKENGFVTITLPFEVLETYHIQSNSEISNALIATEITFKDSNAYTINSKEFSLKQDETIILNGDEHKIISNQFEVIVSLQLNENTSNLKLEGELYYQACSDTQCLFPRSLNFQISL